MVPYAGSLSNNRLSTLSAIVFPEIPWRNVSRKADCIVFGPNEPVTSSSFRYWMFTFFLLPLVIRPSLPLGTQYQVR
jgi:hypothetical protein